MRGQTRLSRPATTRLSGRWLLLARLVWIGLMLLFCGLYLAALLVYYLGFHGLQEGVYAHLVSLPAVVSGYDAIASLYLPFTGPYATLNVTLMTLLSLFWIAVSLVLFWRRSDDWMALFVALFLVMLATNLSPAILVLARVVGLLSPLGVGITLLHLLTWSSLAFFFALFPDGRFVPGWTRWLTLAYLVWQVPLCLPSNSPFSLTRWSPLLLASIFLGLVLAWGFAQLYRYRRVSTAVQRQQTKWVVFGMLVGTLVDAANLLPPLVLPALAQPDSAQVLYTLLSEVTFPLGFLFVPCTMGIAMLRYRLWDIDTIINKTLVYGLLTTLLALVYVGLIITLQALLRAIFQQNNAVAIVVSTLAIFVLFQPLRARVQRFIDRRFYRQKYNAARTLAAFSATLRHEVDLDDLSRQLVAVVQETMQPVSVSLWVRPPAPHGNHQGLWSANPPVSLQDEARIGR
jgi:hypothetical protein